MDEDTQYYYSLNSHRVVRADEEKSADRLGPYATRADAENAMREVQQRNDAWDNDPTWNDEDDPDATRPDGSPIEKD